MAYSPYGHLIWSTTRDFKGVGTGTSGPLDIRDASDVWLAVYAVGANTGTAPTLTVQLDVLDSKANVFPGVLALAAIGGSPGYISGSAGLHIAGNGSMLLPRTCQVTWTLGGTNPFFPGVTISLYGR